MSRSRSRLSRDTAYRAETRQRIAADKHRVYRDETCLKALEDFLQRVARR